MYLLTAMFNVDIHIEKNPIFLIPIDKQTFTNCVAKVHNTLPLKKGLPEPTTSVS